jgi:amino acid transporter
MEQALLGYSHYAVLHHHRSCRSPQWQDWIPSIQLFYNVTRSYVDGNVMIAIVIIALLFAVVSEIATASRQIWSFARDNGLPFSCQHVAFQLQLNRSHRSLGSSVALNAIASLTLLSSYILSIGCFLSKRLRREPLPAARFSINIIAISFFVFCFFPTKASHCLRQGITLWLGIISTGPR